LRDEIARKQEDLKSAKSDLIKEFEQKNVKLRKAYRVAREHHLDALNSTDNRKATENKYQQVKSHLRLFRIATAAHLDRMVDAMVSVRDQMPKNLWDMMAEDKEALESMAAINVDGRTLQDIRHEWQEKQRDQLIEIAEDETNQMLSDQLLGINVDDADKLKVEV
jgi:hypothetical protein